MTTEPTSGQQPDPCTADGDAAATGGLNVEQIDAMLHEDDLDPDEIIEAKIQEAIAAAIAAGDIDENLPIVVGIDPTSGTIHVDNRDTDDDGRTDGAAVDSFSDGDDGERLPPFELPASFFAHRDTISEPDKYIEHTSKHWGF